MFNVNRLINRRLEVQAVLEVFTKDIAITGLERKDKAKKGNQLPISHSKLMLNNLYGKLAAPTQLADKKLQC